MRVWLLAIAVSLAGCYTPYLVKPGRVAPATASVAPAEVTAVWRRAVTVLRAEGYVPQVLSQEAGYVSGRRDDYLNDAGQPIGEMAVVTVSPEGSVEVELTGAGWKPASEDITTRMSKRQADLLRRILAPPASPVL